MEKTIEELQVDMRIAEAKIDLLFKYIGYLTDELNRSEATDWNQYDLRRKFLGDYEAQDAGEEAARTALEFPEDDSVGVSLGAVYDHLSDRDKRLTTIRKEIAAQIKHSEA